MPHSYPYKYGDTEPRNIGVAQNDQVFGGDMVHTAGGTAQSAADVANASASTFVANFAGVAFSDSDDDARSKYEGTGETHEIAVGTAGVYEFEIAALGSDAEVGEYVTIAQGASNLNPKAVAITGTASEAIGIVAQKAHTGDTMIKVQIKPQVWNNAIS